MSERLHYIFDEKSLKAIPFDVSSKEELIRWAELLELQKGSGVGTLKTRIQKHEVSTVFLFINHAFIDGAEPLLFETMIFPQKEGTDIDIQWRYSTWEEAQEGHEKAIELLKDYLNNLHKTNADKTDNTGRAHTEGGNIDES